MRKPVEIGRAVNEVQPRTVGLRGRIVGVVVALFVLLPTVALAADQEPIEMIETKVENLLQEFSARRQELAADKRKLFELVGRSVLPLFDFQRIAKLILAKNWKRASAVQRQDFRLEFEQLLIRTYATALFRYTGNERIMFNSSRITEKKGHRFATVEADVFLPDRPPVAVKYFMLLEADQHWKIFNLEIAGLNMVSHYRKIYTASIEAQGLNEVIESMRQTNAVTEDS